MAIKRSLNPGGRGFKRRLTDARAGPAQKKPLPFSYASSIAAYNEAGKQPVDKVPLSIT